MAQKSEVVKEIAAEAEEKFGAILTSASGGEHSHIVNFNVNFDVNRPITEEEGRRIVMTLHDNLRDKINAKKEMRPYLHEYPYPDRRVSIFLYSRKPGTWDYYESPMISGIFDCAEEVRYKTNAVEYLSETLDEARAKL